MTSEDYVSNLLKVSELKNEIKKKFTAQNLQDQGLKQDLTRQFQPVTESQTKTKDDIITHLSNAFPDLITSIDQVKSLLDTKTTEIINKINTKEDAEERFEDAESENSEEYDHLVRLAEARKTDEIKKYLENETRSDNLLRFVQQNDINLSTNPWRQIQIADPVFYKLLKTVKTTKKGTGVKFLPSGKEELMHELLRLMGSYKSGNKNVYNELNAVVDQLRRNGTLSIEQSKRIYKTIS